MKLFLRIGFALVAVIALASCSSVLDGVATNETTGETLAEETTTTVSTGPLFVSWQDFSQWQADSSLVVDGIDVEKLGTAHECFNDECGSPMDYWITTDAVVALGSKVTIRTEESIHLTPSWRRLTDDLRWERGPVGEAMQATVTLEFEQVGLYHVDVQGDLNPEADTALTRIRHFMWVQVVDPAAKCLDGGSAVATRVTGTTDAMGCPTSAATLNIESLHPEFHCHPWPATLQLESRGGERFQRNSFGDRTVEILDTAPEDLTTVGAFIAVGEVHESPSNADAVFVKRPDGALERWSVDDEGMACA